MEEARSRKIRKKHPVHAKMHGERRTQYSRIHAVGAQIIAAAAQFAQTEQSGLVAHQALRRIHSPCRQFIAGEKIPLFLKQAVRQLHTPGIQHARRGKFLPHGKQGLLTGRRGGKQRTFRNGLDHIPIRMDNAGDDIPVVRASSPLRPSVSAPGPTRHAAPPPLTPPLRSWPGCAADPHPCPDNRPPRN